MRVLHDLDVERNLHSNELFFEVELLKVRTKDWNAENYSRVVEELSQGVRSAKVTPECLCHLVRWS
jgi:hypothetical protein